MNSRGLILRLTAAILAIVLLAGCAAPASQSTVIQDGPGILRSTDHGANWVYLGNARMHDLGNIALADPTPLVVGGRIVLYFVDLLSLDKGVLYRTTSKDGVTFDKPQSVYTHGAGMMDPFVLRMPDGSLRMYALQGPVGVISATSRDGITFTSDNGVRTSGTGGMPGALLLPDNRVRLFPDGGPFAKGLTSLISEDGLNFMLESGVRIPKPTDYLSINNPQPIRLADGSYLMLYQAQDKQHEGREEWQAEVHLASSEDGFNWTADPKIIGYGGTSCVVQKPDGTLLMYVSSYLPAQE